MMFETNSIGIDIRRDSIRIAVASSQGGRVRILDLVEKQIPEAPQEELIKLSAALIHEAFVENGLNGDTCIASLPAVSSINRLLTSPVNDLAKIRQTLKFQMEPQIPYPVDQVISDFIPVRKTGEGMELLAVAVTKEAVAHQLSILREAGIEPQLITLDILALSSFYLTSYDFSAERVTALLRLDSDGAILAFFRGDKLIGYRNFQGAPVDEAAEKKVAKEIHRTMLAHQASEGASGEIGAICVTGPNADKFRSLLQERFADIPFRVIGFNDNSVVDIPPFLLAGAEQCQLAIALAHAGLGNGKNQVNFRQEEFAPVSLLSRLKPNIYFSLGVLAVALTAWFASVSFSNRYQTRQLEALNQEMVQAFADTLPTVKSPEDVQRKIREEQEKFRLLKRYSSDYVAPLDALAEVTAGIPEGKPVALSDFGISDNTLRISGEVESFDDINLFKSNLDNSALLADVKIESATKAEKTNKITFRIKAQVGRRPQASAAAPSGGDA